jgi:hypothetical protein
MYSARHKYDHQIGLYSSVPAGAPVDGRASAAANFAILTGPVSGRMIASLIGFAGPCLRDGGWKTKLEVWKGFARTSVIAVTWAPRNVSPGPFREGHFREDILFAFASIRTFLLGRRLFVASVRETFLDLTHRLEW